MQMFPVHGKLHLSILQCTHYIPYPLINISMMSNLKDYNYRHILITYGLSSEGLVLSGLVNDKVCYDNKYIKYFISSLDKFKFLKFWC